MSEACTIVTEVDRTQLARVSGAFDAHGAMERGGRIYAGSIGEDFDSAPCIGQSMMVGGAGRNITMGIVTLGGVLAGWKVGKTAGKAALFGLAANTAGNMIEDMAKTKLISSWARGCDKK